MLLLRAVFVALCLPIGVLGQVAGASTPFKSCGADPVELRVQGCTDLPCKLYKGASAAMEVDFQVGQNTEGLTVSVVASVFGTKTDFPLSNKDACHALTNAECPLDQGELVTYRLQLPVDASYPELTLPIEVSLKDKNTAANVVCFAISVAIVPSPSR